MIYEALLFAVVMLLIGLGVAAQYRLMAKNAETIQLEAKRELESCRSQARNTLTFDREAVREQALRTMRAAQEEKTTNVVPLAVVVKAPPERKSHAP